uniref:Insulin-like domain-containing protein n=1 Tax=Cacopsylla melanoneura TaxID=428564 RepID=A0A8D8LXH3_9HEMI
MLVPSHLTWCLLVFTLSHYTNNAHGSPNGGIQGGMPRGLNVQVCGEALNHVIKLVCQGVYRRKRSLFPLGEYGLEEPYSIASSSDLASTLDPSDIKELLELFGEDLPLEDYLPLSFLLKENALYLDTSETSRSHPTGGSHNEPGSPYYTTSRYLRLRRHQKTGVNAECCNKKCSYNTLRSYCGAVAK